MWVSDQAERRVMSARPESLNEIAAHIHASSDVPAPLRRLTRAYGLVALVLLGPLYGAVWLISRPLRLGVALAFGAAIAAGFGFVP